MLDYNREGPAFVPERTVKVEAYTTCAGCKFHQHNMVKSGMHPVYVDNCHHPLATMKGNFLFGNLQRNFEHRLITPVWCPFLKQNSI